MHPTAGMPVLFNHDDLVVVGHRDDVYPVRELHDIVARHHTPVGHLTSILPQTKKANLQQFFGFKSFPLHDFILTVWGDLVQFESA